jgi:hypothetical protein
MTDTDRKHLAAILGMLGSEHAGERAAAALQAEAFRKRQGLTWIEMMASETVFVDRPVSPSPLPPIPQPWVSLVNLQGLRHFLSLTVLVGAPLALIFGLGYWLH